MNSTIKVFKFGGASVKDAAGVKNVSSILSHYKEENLLIIVSAMGKSTNALEAIIAAHATQDGTAKQKYEEFKEAHYSIMRELFSESNPVFSVVHDQFVEIEWMLEEAAYPDYDYMYDQIVCIGELVSSRILAACLNESGLPTQWLDSRDVLISDNTYREGRIQWDKTISNAHKVVSPMLEKGGFVLTQGFISSSSENFTVTLGREGSDYSAAIFSYCLDAESMTIWKDVPGVLTADPRLFENVTKLDRLSYKEAIEMTYYGATVIHPKTIKPLQNKSIPLYVKSFIKPKDDGTVITSDEDSNYPPIVIVEKNQALLYISSRDFSFIAEHHLSRLFTLFDKYRIWINMMRNTAISFVVCVPNHPDRLKSLFKELESEFSFSKEEGCELVTVRHYHQSLLDSLKIGKVILQEETGGKTYQMVTKDLPIMKRKDISAN